MDPRKCKSCEKKTMRVRCIACEAALQQWLSGGPHYTPMWNGVVSAPPDADEPRSSLDRALALKPDNG